MDKPYIRSSLSSYQIFNSNGLKWYSPKSTENIELILILQLQWTPMGSNDKQLLDLIITILIFNLQLQLTHMVSNTLNRFIIVIIYNPNSMGSNGKQLLDQIIIILIFNLQLQWAPIVRNTFVRLSSSSSTISNSNGLQWTPMVSILYICSY